MATTKRPKIALPAGEAVLAFVDRPSTKFNEDGEYAVIVRLDPKDAKVKELMKSLTTAAEAARKEEAKKNPKVAKYALFVPFKDEENEEGEKTGMVVFKAKSKAKIEYNDETKPIVIPMFDAKGARMNAAIGRGSVLRVSAQIIPIAVAATKMAGVSLRLSAVQVLKLEQYSGGNADSFGFDVEDGYESPEQGSAESDEAPEASEGDSDSSDF